MRNSITRDDVRAIAKELGIARDVDGKTRNRAVLEELICLQFANHSVVWAHKRSTLAFEFAKQNLRHIQLLRRARKKAERRAAKERLRQHYV